jgi:hypothetical protein
LSLIVREVKLAKTVGFFVFLNDLENSRGQPSVVVVRRVGVKGVVGIVIFDAVDITPIGRNVDIGIRVAVIRVENILAFGEVPILEPGLTSYEVRSEI